MKKLLSYIYPVTKTITSEHNGILELTWHNGKKHLNTKNANYSYGSLQRILKFGLEQIDINQVRSILLLGLGGGSVIETLRKDFNYEHPITAVDIDPVIIDIANEEYGITTDTNLKIVCADAKTYMRSNTATFDLIIIDLFVDITVPKDFLELTFWEHVLKAKSTNGCILFNASLEKETSRNLKDVISFLKANVYKVAVFDKVNNTNTVIIATAL